MTKKETFATIKTLLADNAEIVAFCDHEIELLSKPRKVSNKPTVKQIANEAIKSDILEVLTEADRGLTATEIAKAIGEEVTNQKVTALIRQMNGVAKEVVNGKSLFSLA